ncbi:MAG: hypothetical protein C5B59_11515 [Bacteroidetes bacterium]|nr:MAG: hypothetical protein C5B59_11515 [Bacteroidota bacterium]
MATMVRDGGHLIERDLRGKAMFITLTIAGGTLGAYEVMSAKSGHIVNIFNTWLRDRCLHGWYTYVWELQGRGAPHLHYLCTVPKNVTVREFRESVHREWRKILCDLSDATGVDLFRAADGTDWRARQSTPWVGVKLCTHDLGRYMAKYASKSRSKGGDAPSWRPGRWAALSYPLRAAVLKERVVVRIDFAGEKEARLALSRLVSAAALKCHAPFYVPAERCYGALVCSVDTFVGCAKPLALALYELQLTGEINPVLALTSVDRKAA